LPDKNDIKIIIMPYVIIVYIICKFILFETLIWVFFTDQIFFANK